MKRTILSLTAFLGFMRFKFAEQRGSFSTDDAPPADPPADDAPPSDDAPAGDDDTPPPGDDAPPEEPKVPLKALQEERRKRQEEEERARRLERLLDDKMEQKPKPEPQEQKAVIPPGFPAKPTVDQFETYDDYVEAVTDWKTDLKFAQRDFQQQATAQKTEQQKVFESHVARVNEAKGKYADFDAVIETTKDLPVKQEIITAIVESDVSADLLYHLAKNPKEVEKLNTLPERAMLRELGKIESKLTTPAPKKPSAAPEPINPVGGSGGKATKAVADMTDEEFIAHEREKAKSRGRLW